MLSILKLGFKINILAIILAICFVFPNCVISSAQEDAASVVVGDEPLILATAGLGEKEQSILEKRYRYTFRRKDIIQEPFISTPFIKEPSISPIGTEFVTEEEKLYRYFGIATILYDAGRLEEAEMILKYILMKRPDDKFVKNYLNKINKEKQKKDRQWRITSKRDAKVLKEIKIKNLIKDGEAYYKQEDYNRALLNFADVLTLNPNNSTAKAYMAKLKKYYLETMKVENIVEEWKDKDYKEDKEKMAEAATPKPLYGNDLLSNIINTIGDLLETADLQERGYNSKTTKATRNLLDKAEKKEEILMRQERMAAEQLLDEQEIKDMVDEIRISSLMDQAELGLKIEGIISERKEEERRENSYTLGPGDALRISVQDHPELSGVSSVGPNGDIVLPLVNEPIPAQGLTVEEISDKVIETLKRYVKDPVVYVGITAYKSKIFYVIDEIGCTPYNITRANFTLRDALFTADWGSNRALGRILLMRPHKLHPIIKKVDGFDLVYRGNLAQNIRIKNGDVIYIPLTAANKIATTIADALSPIKAIRDVRNEWLDQRWNEEQGWDNLFRIPRNKALQELYKASSAEATN